MNCLSFFLKSIKKIVYFSLFLTLVEIKVTLRWRQCEWIIEENLFIQYPSSLSKKNLFKHDLLIEACHNKNVVNLKEEVHYYGRLGAW